MAFKLRYYQQDAVDAFFDHCEGDGINNLLVIPTAGGKSVVQAEIIRRMMEYNGTRILLLTHQKTLIQQNYEKFMRLMDSAIVDAGIYSAGLKSRDTSHRVIFAGIQSVHDKAWQLGFFDVIIIDEAHSVPVKSEGTYRKFLDEMKKINPKIIISGMSATPYRLKGGLLCDKFHKDRIFEKVAYECTIPELIDPNHVKNRDKVRYLSPLISKGAVNKADMSGVHIRSGEYAQEEMEKAFNAEGLVAKAVKEILSLTKNRKHVLIFTSGIDHCHSVFDHIVASGETAGIGHSKMGDGANDQTLLDFTGNGFKYLVNVNMWTTGFDFPGIDCVCMLRSTMSPGLYCQCVGRGFRLENGKEDCLVLDFGGNIARFGPVDKIYIKENKEGKSEVGSAPTKECPQCHSMVALSARICDGYFTETGEPCNFVFPEPELKHDDTASEESILSKWKKPELFNITKVRYSEHWKDGKPHPSLRVDYFYNDLNSYFSNWVCVEHDGYARKKAEQWLKQVTDKEIYTVEDAIANKDTFRTPKSILVDFNGRFPEIKGYNF